MDKPISVKDIMARNIITFHPDQNASEVIDRLIGAGISGGAVVDAENRLVGVISEKDCLKTIVKSSYYDSMGALVSDLMSTAVATVDANDSVHSVAQKFLDSHYRRFPVLENGKLIGQVSRRDILRAVQHIPH